MSFQERASCPISSVERTGTRAARSPAPAFSMATRSRFTGRITRAHRSSRERPSTPATAPTSPAVIWRSDAARAVSTPVIESWTSRTPSTRWEAGCSWQAVHFGSL